VPETGISHVKLSLPAIGQQSLVPWHAVPFVQSFSPVHSSGPSQIEDPAAYLQHTLLLPPVSQSAIELHVRRSSPQVAADWHVPGPVGAPPSAAIGTQHVSRPGVVHGSVFEQVTEDDPLPDPLEPDPDPTDDPEPEPVEDPEPEPVDEPAPVDDPEPDPVDEPAPVDEPEPDPVDEPDAASFEPPGPDPFASIPESPAAEKSVVPQCARKRPRAADEAASTPIHRLRSSFGIEDLLPSSVSFRTRYASPGGTPRRVSRLPRRRRPSSQSPPRRRSRSRTNGADRRGT
jgi:hypothetical protein